jgi:hypothetical protein
MGMKSLEQESFDELFYQIDNLIAELEVTPGTALHAVAAMSAHLGIAADLPIEETVGLVGMYFQKFKAADKKTTFNVSR